MLGSGAVGVPSTSNAGRRLFTSVKFERGLPCSTIPIAPTELSNQPPLKPSGYVTTSAVSAIQYCCFASRSGWEDESNVTTTSSSAVVFTSYGWNVSIMAPGAPDEVLLNRYAYMYCGRGPLAERFTATVRSSRINDLETGEKLATVYPGSGGIGTLPNPYEKMLYPDWPLTKSVKITSAEQPLTNTQQTSRGKSTVSLLIRIYATPLMVTWTSYYQKGIPSRTGRTSDRGELVAL